MPSSCKYHPTSTVLLDPQTLSGTITITAGPSPVLVKALAQDVELFHVSPAFSLLSAETSITVSISVKPSFIEAFRERSKARGPWGFQFREVVVTPEEEAQMRGDYTPEQGASKRHDFKDRMTQCWKAQPKAATEVTFWAKEDKVVAVAATPAPSLPPTPFESEKKRHIEKVAASIASVEEVLARSAAALTPIPTPTPTLVKKGGVPDAPAAGSDPPTPSPPQPSTLSSPSLFLRLACFSLFCATLSFLQQLDGLYGPGGITPLPPTLPTPKPTLLGATLANPSLFPAATLLLGTPELLPVVKFLAIVGTVAAGGGAVVATGPISRWLLLFLSTAVYLSIVNTVPPPFLNFQWENLLLEAAAAGLLFGPFFFKSTSSSSLSTPHLLLRFAAFKLFFMSGIVKLQAGCPTWEALSATEVHFASQPLPTPTSSLLHSLLPPLAHKLAVAATLWVEIPGAVLLLLPWGAQFGALAQVALQGLILLSGNYNFFNILSLALVLPLLGGGGVGSAAALAPAPAPAARASPPAARRMPLCACSPAFIFNLAFTLGSAAALFSATLLPPTLTLPVSPSSLQAEAEGWGVEGTRNDTHITLATPWWSRLDIAVRKEWRGGSGGESWLGPATDACIRGACVLALVWWVVAVVYSVGAWGAEELGLGEGVGEWEGGDSTRPSRSSPRPPCTLSNAPLRLTLGVFRLALLSLTFAGTGITLAASAVHLATLRPAQLLQPAVSLGLRPITSALGWKEAWGVMTHQGAFPPLALAAYHTLLPWRATAGYGLFRRMTGVGPEGMEDVWGLPVTPTLRPELVVEGWWQQQDGEGGAWKEIPFPYKPGPVGAPPTWVAPHSPRLDWQMWFSALGGKAQDPWLIHLCQLILLGSPPVYSLLVHPTSSPTEILGSPPTATLGWPVVEVVGGEIYAIPPLKIRIKRYAYDFTRYNTSWARLRHQSMGAFFDEPGSQWGLDSLPPAHPLLTWDMGWGMVVADRGANANSTLTLPSPPGLKSLGLHRHPLLTSVLKAIGGGEVETKDDSSDDGGGEGGIGWWDRVLTEGEGEGLGEPYLPEIALGDVGVRSVLEDSKWGGSAKAVAAMVAGGKSGSGGGWEEVGGIAKESWRRSGKAVNKFLLGGFEPFDPVGFWEEVTKEGVGGEWWQVAWAKVGVVGKWVGGGAVKGAITALAFAAPFVVHGATAVGVVPRVGHVVEGGEGGTRMVFVPSSAHASTGWVILLVAFVFIGGGGRVWGVRGGGGK